MPRVNPFIEADVAAAQRAWLAQLQALQPERAILAQTQKTDTWAPWDTYPTGVRLWTRSILLSELLCDVDTPDKEQNRAIAAKWAGGALLSGAVPLGPIDSGGRGWHVQVLFDPDALFIDGKVLDAAEKLGIDAYKVARVTLFEAICEAAGLTPDERGALDDGKVSWTAAKLGSMVRDFGSVGRLGYAKTLSDAPLVVMPDAVPPLWAPSRALCRRIEDALRTQAERIKVARDAEKHAKRALKDAKASILTHPCVAAALKDGAPVGERGTTGLHLLKLCRAEGLTPEQTRAIAAEYVKACERTAPMSDDVVAKVEYVFAGADTPRVKCPNPMGLAVCSGQGSELCPKRRLELHA